MIKKLPTHKLEVGMFIHGFEKGWLDHPFLKGSFEIRSKKEIQKIQHAGIHWVLVNTGKGRIRDPNQSSPLKVEDQHTFSEEIQTAEQLFNKAKSQVDSLFENMKMGVTPNIHHIKSLVLELSDSIFRNADALLFLTQVEGKSGDLYQHSINVSILMGVFAKCLGIDPPLLRELMLGGLLHDVGIVSIPKEVLNKPDYLSEPEYLLIKQHVELGKLALEEIGELPEASKLVVLEHHERLDGSGYPKGIGKFEISFYGRMAAIVDVYDAVTSDRTYRKKIRPGMVLRKMMDDGGKELDRDLLREFIKCVGVFPIGSMVELSDGHIAYVQEKVTNPTQPIVRVFRHKRSKDKLESRVIDLEKENLSIIDFAAISTYL